MRILVTGGTGYIGSHTVVELIQAGYTPVIIDNLSNSNPAVLKRIETIADTKIVFEKVEMTNINALRAVFSKHKLDTVLHFAGLKAVGESVQKPLHYYRQNVISSINLLEVMAEYDCKKLIFSSSCTVYGLPSKIPVDESESIKPTNPYGHTKAMIEQILCDVAATNTGWQISMLRYFNPIGAHSSGLIGEDPNGIPNNLLPYVAQVAVGKRKQVSVFGNDYNTKDGTGIRDYIHVVDLAKGHVAALQHMPQTNSCEDYNLGTGTGYSVLEVIENFKQASGKEIPYQIVDRRPGDIAATYADPTKASLKLKWKTNLSLSDACRDAWNWQSKNPDGYT